MNEQEVFKSDNLPDGIYQGKIKSVSFRKSKLSYFEYAVIEYQILTGEKAGYCVYSQMNPFTTTGKILIRNWMRIVCNMHIRSLSGFKRVLKFRNVVGTKVILQIKRMNQFILVKVLEKLYEEKVHIND